MTDGSGTTRYMWDSLGRLTQAEAGIQYMRARFYDPYSGQFLTRDPLVSASGQPYGSANDSPLAYTDPSGMFSWPSLSQVATRFVGAMDTLTGGLTADAREASTADSTCAHRTI